MSRPGPTYAIADNPQRHQFEVDFGDGTVATAQYDLIAGKIIFTHTHVPESHEGQGVGSALVRIGLRAARDRHLKVIPICPFFAAYMKKHVEEQDLLDPSYRQALELSK